MSKQFSTQAVHAGEEKRKPYGALTTPIVQTSTYTFADTAEIMDFMQRKAAGESRGARRVRSLQQPHPDVPPRASWPPWRAASGPCSSASGMSAITTTIAALLSAGDHLVLASDCYHRTREFALTFLSAGGSRRRLVPIDQPEAFAAAIRPIDAPHLCRDAHQPLPARPGPGPHRRDGPAARHPDHGRQHLCHADQPAAPGARHRPGDAQRHQVPGRPQRPAGRRGHRLAGRSWPRSSTPAA